MFAAEVVDKVTIPQGGGTVDLQILQPDPWSGTETQIGSLREKILYYVNFVLDGLLVDAYPQAAGLNWRIVIICRSGMPDGRTSRALETLAANLPHYGGQLVVTG
jgi:hypothetical protein